MNGLLSPPFILTVAIGVGILLISRKIQRWVQRWVQRLVTRSLGLSAHQDLDLEHRTRS
jgi:hypothetical protein